MTAPLDCIDNIIAFEQGELSNEECFKLFSALIASGLCWRLQGTYGRIAQSLIDDGLIAKDGSILIDLPGLVSPTSISKGETNPA